MASHSSTLAWKIPWMEEPHTTMQEIWVLSLGQEDPLEKGMATHSSILAWRTPWTDHGITELDTTGPPGSPVPGILQARTLEWVAIFFSNEWK